MEAPLVIAAGAYLMHQYVNQPTGKEGPYALDRQTELDRLATEPEQLWMLEYQVNGAPVPNANAPSSRLPVTIEDGTYFMHKPGVSNMENPVTNTYVQLLNRAYLGRKDFEQSRMAARPQYPRKTAQPLYSGFTDEIRYKDKLSGEVLSTGFQQMSWLPRDPTDSDYNDAALLTKVVPPNPLLFTPDANFATAPNVDWRYANV